MSTASLAWLVHAIILKVLLHLMGIPSAVPFLEVVAYAGYAFVHVCMTTILGAAFGMTPPPPPPLLPPSLLPSEG